MGLSGFGFCLVEEAVDFLELLFFHYFFQNFVDLQYERIVQ